MNLLNKLPFLIELLFNGLFSLIYFLRNIVGLFPSSWNLELIDKSLETGSWFVPIILFFSIAIKYASSVTLDRFFRRHIFSTFLFTATFFVWGEVDFIFIISTAHLISPLFDIFYSDYIKDKGNVYAHRIRGYSLNIMSLKPSQLILLSFIAVIFIGALFLSLPISSKSGEPLDFIDALFMATSATCVTGLSTISISSSLTLFGQIVILLLIQIGGLSIMTLYSLMLIFLGKSNMKDRVIMQDMMEMSSLEDLFSIIVKIVKYTFFIELWGAIILIFAFSYEGLNFDKAVYYGFFHSISAFCNAGFSLFNTSLEAYAVNPFIHGTIAVLVTLGGFGFIVLKEIWELIYNRKKQVSVNLSLHSKIVLLTSAILIIIGTIFIFFGEFLNTLDRYSFWEKIQVSLFQSITLRTAGFNTISMNDLNSYTLYGMTLFMFIGGSPGSTSGGLKTTTLAILISSIITTIKGRSQVTIFDRTIHPSMVVRATALTFISILTVSVFILILIGIESEQNFLALFFESISAIGTVGLSLGITPILSVMGKIFILILMLAGRIGPLTLVLAISERKNSQEGKFDYPYGKIMIG